MRQILILGGGFAGVWAALAAARESERQGGDVQVTLLSRDSHLVIRPRLYEHGPRAMRVPLADTLAPAGVRLLEGRVVDIDVAGRLVEWAPAAGSRTRMPYDRLVVALGSSNTAPQAHGLAQYAWSLDSYGAAIALDGHLHAVSQGSGEGNDTFVVVGAGFTGLEIATELRDRIARHGGRTPAESARIVLVDRNAEVGSALGPGPRPVIEKALDQARIERRLGVTIEHADRSGVLLSSGEWIASRTVILTAGMRATPVPGVPGPRDTLGRLPVDDALHVSSCHDVFAAGDSARARVDDAGHLALQSCQHAMTMGRFAGYNAARDLLGLPTAPYRQPFYVTCLDLGRSGAVLTTGWERQVTLTGSAAKAVKQAINRAIYPPVGTREQVLAPAGIDNDGTRGLRDLLQAA